MSVLKNSVNESKLWLVTLYHRQTTGVDKQGGQFISDKFPSCTDLDKFTFDYCNVRHIPVLFNASDLLKIFDGGKRFND